MRMPVRLALFIFFFCSVAGAQTASFKFAWLTDTHVGSTSGAADLELSVRDINANDDLAFVVLSGDITEMGSDAQLDLAKSILDSLRKPYYIIHGNHDTNWSA